MLPEIPKKEENNTKDIVIRVLFTVSVMIFAFSIYVNQQNKKLSRNPNYDSISNLIQYQQSSEIFPEDIIEDENQNNETLISEEQNNTILTVDSHDPKFLILREIYKEIQKSNFDALYQNTENSLKNGSVFKKYFSKSRLQRFVDNIENLDISLRKIEDNTVYYISTYFVNWQMFAEEREVDFDDSFKINRILCSMAGCSTLPFFNPGKYF